MEYSFPDNMYSAGKSNFWDNAKALFGVDPKPNIGLTGNGLSGQMKVSGDHFVADAIPLTGYSESKPTVRDPYQVAVLIAKDSAGNELARTQVVAPVSTEMRCDTCNNDTGSATKKHPITPTGDPFQNILMLHDYLSQSRYPAGHTGALMDNRPVL